MTYPSIAQWVHYQSYGSPNGEYGSVCRAAVVTDVVHDDPRLVSLTIFNPTGFFFVDSWQDEEYRRGGTWHHLHATDELGDITNDPATFAEPG